MLDDALVKGVQINSFTYRVPTLPGKREKSGNSVYTFHGREKSLNFTEIAKIREKLRNFIAGQGSFVVPNLFGY